MSLIVTYRTDSSFIILQLPLVMIWLAERGTWCLVRLRWWGMILSALSALADLFFKLLTPLILLVCRARPGQPSSPASALTFRFYRQTEDPGVKRSRSSQHRIKITTILLVLLSTTLSVCELLWISLELEVTSWNSHLLCCAGRLFSCSAPPHLRATCNETNPLPPMSDYDVEGINLKRGEFIFWEKSSLTRLPCSVTVGSN